MLGKHESSLRIAFYKLDFDGSGRIDVADVRAALHALTEITSDCKLSPAEVDVMVDYFKADSEGMIDWEEFLQTFGMGLHESGAYTSSLTPASSVSDLALPEASGVQFQSLRGPPSDIPVLCLERVATAH